MRNYKIAMSEPDCPILRQAILLVVFLKIGYHLLDRLLKFERRVAKYLSRRFAIATSSGTSAIELSLRRRVSLLVMGY